MNPPKILNVWLVDDDASIRWVLERALQQAGMQATAFEDADSVLHAPVIIITAHADLDSAVAAYRGGAFEYLPKPFDVDDAVALVRRAARVGPRRAGGQVETERPARPCSAGRRPCRRSSAPSAGWRVPA
jgi:two-component system, NtrC family, nitrogen regulation response regulator GlnG